MQTMNDFPITLMKIEGDLIVRLPDCYGLTLLYEYTYINILHAEPILIHTHACHAYCLY